MSAECWRRQATRPARHTTVPVHGGCWRTGRWGHHRRTCGSARRRMYGSAGADAGSGYQKPVCHHDRLCAGRVGGQLHELGAEDYIPKTLLQEKLLPRIRELVRKTERRHTMPILERRSAAFRTIDRRISLVAPTDIGVLIRWRERHGKEHVAERYMRRVPGRKVRLSQ